MSDKSSSTRKKTTASKPGRRPKITGYTPFWHSRGGWTIKVEGKCVYLGRDATKAEAKFRDKVLPNIRTGHKPNADRLTLGELVAAYLAYHENRVSAGELGKASFKYYRYGCRTILKHLGSGFAVEDVNPGLLAPIRAKLILDYVPNTAEKYIRTIRSLLKSAHESLQLIDSPVRIGDALKAPSARLYREHEIQKKEPYLTCEEVARLLLVSDARWQSMILFGYFAGFCPGDLAVFPLNKLELNQNDGWLDWYRPKTKEHWRAYLPPLMVRFLNEYLASKPAAKEEAANGLVFLTRYRKQISADGLGQRAKKTIFRKAGVPGTFRWLRNSCATLCDDFGDARAQSLTMGHKQGKSGHSLGKSDMTGRYVKAISDERLKAIGCYLEQQLLDAMEAVQ